ncbi:MAG: DUF4350 domain-containing protein [Candidatus Hodarchaeales archaeon]
MNKQIKLFMYGFIGLMCTIAIILPPIAPAAFTTKNTGWDGASDFFDLFIDDSRVSVSYIPLSLLGDLNDITDVIIIIGGNIPYFPEESQHLLNFVLKGGKVVLFEDKGYGRILTEPFGLNLGGILIDQEYHGRNPYQPKSLQEELILQNVTLNSHSVIFNHGVHVEQLFSPPNTNYYPLFPLEGSVWEDKNSDGKFYLDEEKCLDIPFVGGIIEYKENDGLFAVIGDSAFPTNDMISREENSEWLKEFLDLLMKEDNTRILFDESRKLWVPPTGGALVSYISVIILGIFHSPLIAFSFMIIMGGILAIRKNEEIINFGQRIKQPFDKKLRIPSQAFLQSAEEEIFSKYGKNSASSSLYRDLIVEELLELVETLTDAEKTYFEDSLRQRIFTFAEYEKHRYQIKKIKERIKED